MKLLFGAALILAAIWGVFGTRAIFAANPKKSAATPQEVYQGLRRMALDVKPGDLNIGPTNSKQPYGIVMDIGFEEGTATLASFSNGEASLYLSGGGGTIGGGAHESVAAAAERFVAATAQHLGQFSKSETQPLPRAGDVTFYVLTPDGVPVATRREDDLGEERDALSPLFYAGQEVITQIRMIEEKKKN